MAYLADDGEYLCQTCATTEGHLGGDNDGFRVVGFVSADGHDYGEGDWTCAHCNTVIDPDPAAFDDAEQDQIYAGYVECAMWAGLDWTHCATPDDHEGEDCNPETCVAFGNPAKLDDYYDADDISAEAEAEIREDISGFVNDPENAAALRSAFNGRGWGLGQIGHDFYLTRNRHGAGFWDRGAGTAGDTLTEAAHVYGSSDLDPNGDGSLGLSH